MALTQDVIAASELAQKILDGCDKWLEDDEHPSGNLNRVLRKLKLNPLNSGHYGSVLDIPGTKAVLKVAADPRDGYQVFAEWAKANPMPGVPAIFYTYLAKSGVFFAAMPKYKGLNGEDKDRVELQKRQARNDEPVGYLAKAVRAIREQLGSLAEEDMHGGNFMYCGETGTYVVTDPLARVYGSTDEARAQATGATYVRPIEDQLGFDFSAAPAGPVITGRMACPNPQNIPRNAVLKLRVPDWANDFVGVAEDMWPVNWGNGEYHFDWAANPGVRWIAWDDTVGEPGRIATWTLQDAGRPSPGVWRCCRKRPAEFGSAFKPAPKLADFRMFDIEAAPPLQFNPR